MTIPILQASLLAAWPFALCSCVATRQAVFNEAEFRPYGRTGSGSVTGQAFTVFKDNSIHYATNCSISLAPATSYTKEFIDQQCASGKKLSPGDPRFLKYRRTTQTDTHGQFTFRHLPPGEYYAVTEMPYSYEFDWNQITGADNDITVQHDTGYGAQWIYAKVSVSNGQTATISQWGQGHSHGL